ncbi:hypothetical protein ABU614_06830 [Lysobacter firmicutimachus]|uniref:Uncharacterized protein n=1 Tax=Lysobacter firmicutimachus TaxID=1792846 RepID=A0AAU8MTQ0_9GAMM
MHDAVPTQSGYDLAALPATLLQMVEEILSNDESSSDAELAQYLTEVGLSDTQARDALAYRDLYRLNLWVAGCTPIRGGVQLRYNGTIGQFELA